MNQPLENVLTQESLIYVGGDWVSESKASVSVFDHGLLYGDGVYEGLRCYNGKIFRAAEHYKRLERSALCLDLKLPCSIEELDRIIKVGLKRNKLSNAYIRAIITRGVGPIGPDPRACKTSQLVLILKDIPPLHGKHIKGINVALSTVRRVAIDSASAQIKSLNYLPTVMAKNEARRMGLDDVIMLDSRGMVAEAPVANLFMVLDGVVRTPSVKSGILDGVTRRAVIQMLVESGVTVLEDDITPYELTIADEIFLTGTHAEIVSVGVFNGITIGDGSIGQITQKVRELFDEATQG